MYHYLEEKNGWMAGPLLLVISIKLKRIQILVICF